FRGGGARIFVQKDAARAAARSPRADDGRPRGTDTFDRHDGVHDGDVSLVDSHPAAVESDRVLFRDHRKIERRLVAAVTDLTAATAARVLENGKFFLILLNPDRGKVTQEQRDPTAEALLGIVGDVVQHPRHPALLTAEAQALLKCLYSVFPIRMGKEEGGPLA